MKYLISFSLSLLLLAGCGMATTEEPVVEAQGRQNTNINSNANSTDDTMDWQGLADELTDLTSGPSSCEEGSNSDTSCAEAKEAQDKLLGAWKNSIKDAGENVLKDYGEYLLPEFVSAYISGDDSSSNDDSEQEDYCIFEYSGPSDYDIDGTRVGCVFQKVSTEGVQNNGNTTWAWKCQAWVKVTTDLTDLTDYQLSAHVEGLLQVDHPDGGGFLSFGANQDLESGEGSATLNFGYRIGF